MRVAVFGAGYVGLVTGACFAGARPRRRRPRRRRRARSPRCERGEVPIHEPGLEELLARNRERLTFTTDVAEAVDGARRRLHRGRHAADRTPATPTSRRSGRSIDELPAVDRRIVVAMKSTVPVGTGRAVRHRLDERGLAHVGYVSNPEFTAEGTAVQDFMQPDRIVIGAFDDADGDVVASSTRASTRRSSRCDVASAEMIKLAANAALDDADLVHQRDRERLRGDRRRRHDGRRGHRPRPPHRPELPARGDRLRRLVLPEGLARAQAARGELGLPLPAPERRDRGERAAEAARDRRSSSSRLGPLRGQADRAARARVQAGHRRHARGAEPRPRRAAALRGRGRHGLGPGRERRGAPARRRDRDDRARGARRRRRGGARHRVARAARARLGRGGASACATGVIVDGREPARSRGDARARVRLRGHRPPVV